ncbi:hypothetical protein PIB30_060210 [Stylosanthes scabra]|uniref:Secreted protein n=1 Tax=Stylosanthes scabra TaxID=79078 RepID=A0ABU6YHY4_9FABA|nr:hypothetical protein [Stylosanthes scabra]
MSITTVITVFACIAGAPPRLPCRITTAVPAAADVLRGRRRSLTPLELVVVVVVLLSRAALSCCRSIILPHVSRGFNFGVSKLGIRGLHVAAKAIRIGVMAAAVVPD